MVRWRLCQAIWLDERRLSAGLYQQGRCATHIERCLFCSTQLHFKWMVEIFHIHAKLVDDISGRERERTAEGHYNLKMNLISAKKVN